MKHWKITVYDVAPNILSMFDEKLGKYAIEHFRREGIAVKTSHHVEWLRKGVPEAADKSQVKESRSVWTLKVKEEGEIGCGMVVWSTGLMMNPFVDKAISTVHNFPLDGTTCPKEEVADAQKTDWTLRKDPKTQALITDEKLRLELEPEKTGQQGLTRTALKVLLCILS